ncbi:MAG: lipid A phosphoethanolamine transferase [Clostridium sp.]|nr:lipid A phosphoethanolamine transferase [Prevotella sp.]MCM1429012.1 lipid A phosphoethanolamine transferase [Clostridium sp.]MCM1475458.1 lipid A phosphoethanolamine transferase [Muribaculaceae bacterium]
MRNKTAIALFIYLIVLLILPNVILSVTECMNWWGRIVNVVLPLGLYALFVSLSPKIGRCVWLSFPLLFLASFQLVILALFGHGIIAVDMFLNLVTTNSQEAGELLGDMQGSVITIMSAYGLLLIFGTILWIRNETLKSAFLKCSKRLFLYVLAVGFLILPLCYISGNYSIERDLYPVNVLYNIYLACDRTLKTENYFSTSKGYSYKAEPTHPREDRELYVLVVGETSRADNWELNGYHRPTNPRLSQRTDLLFAPKAFSESNTTHKSVPMLLSPVTASNFNTEIYKVKSIITAFKEAGFYTAFISNQLPNGSFIDFFGEEADTTLFVRLNNKNSSSFYDLDLLKPLDDIISQGYDKQLIVLHTYGSHFNYQDRYPKSKAYFKPDDYSSAGLSNKQKLINAYDNTICMTDELLDELIRRIQSQGILAALLYTSDHGEDLYEDGESFLHSSPTPTRWQLHVPLLAWLSPAYLSKYPEKAEILQKNFRRQLSTTRTFTPTALGIAGIKSPRVNSTEDLTSTAFQPRPRLYLTDHNIPERIK